MVYLSYLTHSTRRGGLPVAFTVQSEAPPLHEDATGALRVGDSRVLLELVVRAFEDGATPEAIVQRYSTLSLSEAYTAVAYYLRHRGEVEVYLRGASGRQRKLGAARRPLTATWARSARLSRRRRS